MTLNYEYCNGEGDDASSAVITKEAETRILSFDPEKRLRELNQELSEVALQRAFELELVA